MENISIKISLEEKPFLVADLSLEEEADPSRHKFENNFARSTARNWRQRK